MTDTTNDPLDPALDDMSTPEAEETDEQIWDSFDKPPADKASPGQEKDNGDAAPDFADPSEDGNEDDPDGDGATGDEPAQLREQVARLERQLKSQNGRVAAKDREIAQLNARIAQREERVAKREQANAKAKEREAALEAARTEYGDVIGPLADELADLKADREAALQTEQDQLAADKAALDRLHKEQETAFLKEHPDGFETIIANRKLFDEWVDDQPSAVRKGYKANRDAIVDGAFAASLVAQFKLHLRETGTGVAPAKQTPSQRLAAKRDAQLTGARAPRTPQTTRTTAALSEGATDDEIWAAMDREDAMKAARRR